MHAIAISRLEGWGTDGIHVLWTGPRSWGYAPNGYWVYRRKSLQGKIEDCEEIAGAALADLQSLHVREMAAATVRFRHAACPEKIKDLAQVSGLSIGGGRDSADRTKARAAEGKGCERYRFDLRSPQPAVRLELSGFGFFAVALREGKVVAAADVTGSGGVGATELRADQIDTVIVYCGKTDRIRFCVMTAEERKRLDHWSGAEVIAKALQLPIREINGEVSTFPQELALARGRMLPPMTISDGDFSDLAEVLRELVTFDKGRPVERLLHRRDTKKESFQELDLLGLGLAPQLDPDGRRMLGLGVLDQHGLTPGQSYDYRIAAEFPVIDLLDRVLSLATVPTGTALPDQFHLGPVLVSLAKPWRVETFPDATPEILRHVVRRGIRLSSDSIDYLILDLADPVTELTLELDADAGAGLEYEARIASAFPLPPIVGPIPADHRVPLTFSSPIDRIAIKGKGFFCGLRLHGVVGSARDPKQMAMVSAEVDGVVFQATAAPPPPDELTAANLQEPPLPQPVADSVERPPHSLGFQLRWRGPFLGGISTWTPDLDQPPPLEALGHVVERRRTDDGSPWNPIGPRTVHGNRQRPASLHAVSRGDDLLALFADDGRDDGAGYHFTYDDPLQRLGQEGGAKPGTHWEYRIASINPTGRQSTGWCTSNEVVLEKRVPPPPPGPPPGPAPGGSVQPTGMRARVLERGAPDLTADEQAILGTHANAILLHWGWSARERQLDPFASQFRIYFQPLAADVLPGQILPGVVLDGTRWRLQVRLERAVAADALVGLRIRSDEQSYRIVQHDAGGGAAGDLSLWVAPLIVEPAHAPIPGRFRLQLGLGGEEARPATFESRTKIVPLDSGEAYQTILYDALTPSPERPFQTAWVGVSGADSEPYVADTIPATVPNGGQPGNESQILVRTVTARYRGQPELVAPPPLADVPEQITREIAAGAIRVELALPALVRSPPAPATPLAAGEMVRLERLAASELTRRLRRQGPQTFQVTRPDGSQIAYSPASAADRAALDAQLLTGQPEQVEGRFVRDLLIQVPQLGDLFAEARAKIPFGAATDALPPQAERYLYRLRRVDATGHRSSGAILLDAIVRVPSPRQPGTPELTLAPTVDDRVRVSLRIRKAFDQAWVALFLRTSELDTPSSGNPDERVELVRLPDRRDLYPDHGLALRTADGLLLQPVCAEAASGTEAGGFVTVAIERAVGHGKRVTVWAVAISRDGIPSAPGGARTTSTARAPITAPALVVTREPTRARLSWLPAAGTETLIERQVAGGDWEPASAWLGAASTATPISTAARIPAEPIAFRLRVRTVDGRQAVGEGIPLT